MYRTFLSVIAVTACLTLTGTARSGSLIRYEGSPAIGKFIDIANSVYGKSTFLSNVMSKNKGGEECILKGTCDIGGVTNIDPGIKRKGVRATLIGRDGVVVIINRKNPVDKLSIDQLRAIFSGKVSNWKELGGPDLPILPLITSSISGTHELFSNIVMKGAEFKARTMEPDPTIALYVSRNQGAIGFTSFFLLKGLKGVTAVRPNGEEPSVSNPGYPLSRPLYLLTKDPPPKDVKDFLDWTLSRKGQGYLETYFAGVK